MKQRLLIVDDDAAVRESLRKELVAAGYEVELAANGRAGRLRIEQGAIDLVLLDLHLPDQSGWEVYEHATTGHPFIPVVILTGLSNQLLTAVAAGVGALLEKPVSMPQLLAAIEALLREPPRQRLERLCGYRQDSRYVPSAGRSHGPAMADNI